MNLRILGPLRLSAPDGSDSTPNSPRQRKILSALLMRAGQSVTVSRLVDAVWDDDPPATAREQIQNCVCRLRGAISAAGVPLTIASRPGGYLALAGDGALDGREFVALLAQARRQAAGDAAAAAATLHRALRLWRGRVLEDVDCPALDNEKYHLEELRVDAILLWAGLAEAAGRVSPDLLVMLRRESALLPCHENLAAGLVRLLIQQGRQPEALDVIRRLKRHLAEDLGLPASPAVRALELDILRMRTCAGPVTNRRELVDLLEDMRRQLTLASELLAQL